MKRLIAIDGNSLMYRAYYALPGMSAKDGTPTGAIYGFISMLLKLLKYEPDYMLTAFDLHAPTFRHKRYSEYKAGRKPTPDELTAQFPIIKKILAEMGIAVVSIEGYEADDILGTAARMANEEGCEAYLVTGDRDALQLVSDKTHVIMTKRGISDVIEYTPEVLFEQYELTPDRMRDLKGLMGDTSDNLPGIVGVGEVTALKLLKKYGTLEETLTRGAIEEKGALRTKIETHADSARMSYELGTIDTHAPVPNTLSDFTFRESTLSGAIPTMSSLQLKSIIERMPKGNADAKASSPEPQPEKEVEVKRLITPEEIESVLPELINASEIAIDITDERASFAVSADAQYDIPFAQTMLDEGLDIDTALWTLKSVFESGSKKTVYDAKRIMHILKRRSISFAGLDTDVMIMDYLLNAVHPAENINELTRDRLSAEYHGAAQLFSLRDVMTKSLEEMELTGLYRDMERALIYVLFDMECEGFAVDRAMLNDLSLQFGKAKTELEDKIYELAGEKFNLQSPKQLGVILFEKLGLKPGKKNARGYSTNAEVLESLADEHPMIPLVIEHRFLAKIKSTFLDGLLQAINPETARVHTTFNQNVTMTGRISSTEPNLQNIPVRTPLGREIRRAFIASPGNVLVDADYSQIELRVLAHMSGDETMIRTFCTDGDIHTQTAAEVFSVSPDEVTDSQRRAAKAVNFGIVYGISDFGLAKNLGITRKEAGEYIKLYFDRYSGVARYMEESLESAKALGYAKTFFGRRRYLAELNSSNYNVRSFGERVARNMPIQGTAADIIKLAMISVHKALKEGGFRAKLVLQIHDELIIDTPEDEAERVANLLGDCMSNVCKLSVPLKADVNIGKTWYDTK